MILVTVLCTQSNLSGFELALQGMLENESLGLLAHTLKDVSFDLLTLTSKPSSSESC